MRRALGTMTGTSADGIDVAVVRIEGEGLSMRAAYEGGWSTPLGAQGARVRELAGGALVSAGAMAELAHELALAHAELIATARAEVGNLDLCAVHGQTVFHRPPVSWQLVNPWPIARAAGCPTVFDLRGADLSAGGQGAPITPIADWVLFRDAARTRAIVNLGGFCNITVVPAGGAGSLAGVIGFDVCVCNQLLDAVAREALGVPFDDGGVAALGGTADARACGDLRRVLLAQRSAGRSLGTGDEAFAWIGTWKNRVSPADLAASAAEAIGAVIAEAASDAQEVVVAGGGTRHAGVVGAIARGVGHRPKTTWDLGVPAEYREAAEMAVLGALCADGVPITLPRVTGVSDPAPIAGAWVRP